MTDQQSEQITLVCLGQSWFSAPYNRSRWLRLCIVLSRRAKEFEVERKQIPLARGLSSDTMEVKNVGSRVRMVVLT